MADLIPDSDPQKEVLAAYINAYEKKFSSAVSGFGGYAYSGMKFGRSPQRQ
ncbi:MAG: hypothetical protein R2860_11225 [Desulfobacterales bacterium]